jgi:hypothetical protein
MIGCRGRWRSINQKPNGEQRRSAQREIDAIGRHVEQSSTQFHAPSFRQQSKPQRWRAWPNRLCRPSSTSFRRAIVKQEDRRIIEGACSQCLLGYYTRLDQRNYEDALKFLTEDAVWVRLGKPLHGIAAIKEALNGRFPGIVVMHAVANIFFEDVSANQVRATALNSVFIGKPGAEKGPASLTLKALVRINPRFRVVGGEWRIEYLDGEELMTNPKD